MTEEDPATTSTDVPEGHESDHRGTFILMLVFIGVIAAMWLWTYLELLWQA